MKLTRQQQVIFDHAKEKLFKKLNRRFLSTNEAAQLMKELFLNETVQIKCPDEPKKEEKISLPLGVFG